MQRYNHPDEPGPGKAYLYDASTGDLLQTIEDPSPAQDGQFGYSVAIDGNKLLVGNPNDDTNDPNQGQAYLFDVSTGNVLLTLNDPTPQKGSSSGEDFGAAVAMDDGIIVISAPYDDAFDSVGGRVFLFDEDTGNLLHALDDPTPNFYGQFGYSVAIDGNQVVVGNPYDDNNGDASGEAHLFDADTAIYGTHSKIRQTTLTSWVRRLRSMKASL